MAVEAVLGIAGDGFPREQALCAVMVHSYEQEISPPKITAIDSLASWYSTRGTRP